MISFRRMICKIFGHRWDKDDWACIDERSRGCNRCYQVQWSEQVGDDGFRWKNL